VSAIDGAELKEGEKIRQKKKEEMMEETRDRTKAQMIANMAKPPPATLIKEHIRQQERAKQEAEDSEKRKILTKIQLYYERFPLLAAKIGRLPQRISLPEAQEVLTQIHSTLDSVGSVQNIYGYVDLGFMKLEQFMGDDTSRAKLPSYLQLNLKGLSTLFRQGKFPELEPIIAQLDIEYPWLGRRGLWWRVLGALQSIALKVHLYNSGEKMIFDLGSRPPVDIPIDPPE